MLLIQPALVRAETSAGSDALKFLDSAAVRSGMQEQGKGTPNVLDIVTNIINIILGLVGIIFFFQLFCLAVAVETEMRRGAASILTETAMAKRRVQIVDFLNETVTIPIRPHTLMP